MTIKEKKLQAFEYFKDRLLSSDCGDHIVRMILFGSLANGRPRRDSDVDVLVLAAHEIDKVEDRCADAAMWAGIEYNESVEPIVRCPDKIRYLNSYFLYNVLEKGKEVYTVKKDKFLASEAVNYLDLAGEYLKLAEYNFKGKHYRGVIDAAYNSAELCAKGLILLKAGELPKTHSGIVTRFSQLYVKPDIVPKETGRELNKSFAARNDARYDVHADINRDKARAAVKTAEKMIVLLEKTA